MIVLAVPGIMAATVVPSLIQKNIQSQNRVKIKKAMTVYDSAVTKMVLLEDIKSESQFKNTVARVGRSRAMPNISDRFFANASI